MELNLPEGTARHLKRTLALAAALVAFPIAIGLVGEWMPGFGFLLFLLAIPTLAISALALLVISGMRGWALAGEARGWRMRAGIVVVGPAMVALAAAALLPAIWTGGYLGSLSRLAVQQSRYEAIVARVSESGEDAWFKHDGSITYSVDHGPPLRVAFNPSGFLDNWSGIVFDPTGEVMLADGFDASGRFRAPERITKLFRGDLVGCRHLWGDYYSCSFT